MRRSASPVRFRLIFNILRAIITAILSLTASPAQAATFAAPPPETALSAPLAPPDASQEASGALFPTAPDREGIPGLIGAASVKYGVSYEELYRTIECESGFDPEAIGDGGTSFGVAQIHLPAHPEITLEDAFDPEWAIDWAAREFAEGRQLNWSCWRTLYERGR